MPMQTNRSTNSRRGFTLIELMITVGLIGVLCAIAIPNFIAYQARSRRSEAYANLASLARAERAYLAERNEFLDVFDSGELTLPDALALALVHSPRLAGASWNVRAAEAERLQARLLPNPELEAEAEEITGSGERRGLETAEMSVRLSQLIELGGKRARRTKVAEMEGRLAGPSVASVCRLVAMPGNKSCSAGSEASLACPVRTTSTGNRSRGSLRGLLMRTIWRPTDSHW